MRVHGDIGMIMRTQQLRAFDADRAVAKRRALGRTGDDADVLSHLPIIRRPGSATARRIGLSSGKNAAEIGSPHTESPPRFP
jgi:hypothetical protein